MPAFGKAFSTDQQCQKNELCIALEFHHRVAIIRYPVAYSIEAMFAALHVPFVIAAIIRTSRKCEAHQSRKDLLKGIVGGT
jgi:hypothetical protein